MALTLDYADLLKALYKRHGSKKLKELINAAVAEATPHRRYDLGPHRDKFESALKELGQQKQPNRQTFNKLATAIGHLGVKIEVDDFAGWNSIAGKKVVVALGEKLIKNSEEELARTRLDVCDVRALIDLLSLFSGRPLHCQLDLELVPDISHYDPESLVHRHKITTRLDAIEQRLITLSADKKVGVIVSLGSDQVNYFSELIANHIAGKQPLPAQFHWSRRRNRRPCKLSSDKDYDDQNVGIGLSEGDNPHWRRDLDKRVSSEAADETVEFKDCGILLVDNSHQRYKAEKEEGPILVVAAGHGGHGTSACTNVLRRYSRDIWEDLENIRESSGKPHVRCIGTNKVQRVVTVNVKKTGHEKKDDMRYDYQAPQLAW